MTTGSKIVVLEEELYDLSPGGMLEPDLWFSNALPVVISILWIWIVELV